MVLWDLGLPSPRPLSTPPCTTTDSIRRRIFFSDGYFQTFYSHANETRAQKQSEIKDNTDR